MNLFTFASQNQGPEIRTSTSSIVRERGLAMLMPLLPGDFAHREYMHIRNLRRIFGIYAAFHGRVSNEDILRFSGAPTLASLIAKK